MRDLCVFGMSGWGFCEGDEEEEVVVSIVGWGVGNVGCKIVWESVWINELMNVILIK